MNPVLVSEYADLRRWAVQFRDTPWNALTLATVTAREPSPMEVMQRLLTLCGDLIDENVMISEAARYYLDRISEPLCSPRIRQEAVDRLARTVVFQGEEQHGT